MPSRQSDQRARDIIIDPETQSALETEIAIDRFLEREPLSIRALIAKADWRQRSKDTDAARLLYTKAIRLSENRPLTPVEAGDVEFATQELAKLQAAAHVERERRLASRKLPSGKWSPRFRHALDIAAGHRKLYLQEPTAFTYPGLPHIPYFEREQFDWVADVEAATEDIRAELLSILASRREKFRAYIQNDASSGPLGGNKALLNNTDWSILPLCENGWLTPEIIQQCPRTWDAILKAPLPRIAGWGPTAVFSMLKAGARIAAHSGMFNTRLICHLPLIVPPDCYFRVGDEVRQWEEGKILIFDDTIEHEAWNESSADRVILIFDIWRPELTEVERHELTALFSD
jgi:aspartyl/asparaginyl beta-hydroxylase (cupin superfamily)